MTEVNADSIFKDTRNILNHYYELHDRLQLGEDNDTRHKFESREVFIKTLNECREVIIGTLKLFIYISEDEIKPMIYDKTKDLYKRSGIDVQKSMTYHDLKNVFEIIDIAHSKSNDVIAPDTIPTEDLDDIYSAMIIFIMEVMRVFRITFMMEGEGANVLRE